MWDQRVTKLLPKGYIYILQSTLALFCLISKYYPKLNEVCDNQTLVQNAPVYNFNVSTHSLQPVPPIIWSSRSLNVTDYFIISRCKGKAVLVIN
jgi:hypothetical protein